jgi:hypothetical protein
MDRAGKKIDWDAFFTGLVMGAMAGYLLAVVQVFMTR